MLFDFSPARRGKMQEFFVWVQNMFLEENDGFFS